MITRNECPSCGSVLRLWSLEKGLGGGGEVGLKLWAVSRACPKGKARCYSKIDVTPNMKHFRRFQST